MCGGSKTITTIVVDSIAFNLNGSPDTRKRYIPSQVFASINRNSPSISKDLEQSLLKGPYSRFRSMMRMVKKENYYTTTGQVKNALGAVVTERNANLLMSLISVAAGGAFLLPICTRVVKDSFDLRAVAAAFSGPPNVYQQGTFARPRPGYTDQFSFLCDMHWVTSEMALFPDFLGIPDTIESSKDYLISILLIPSVTNKGSPVVEPTVELSSWEGESFMEDYIVEYINTTPKSISLTETINIHTQWSDGRPSTNTTVTNSLPTVNTNDIDMKFRKDGYIFAKHTPGHGEVYDYMTATIIATERTVVKSTTITTQDVFREQDGTERVVTTTTTTQYVEWIRKYTRTRQHKNITNFGTYQLFSYKYGTGNATYDQIITESKNKDDYYPVIPIRTSNKTIKNNGLYTALYNKNKKIFKRGFSSSYDKFINEFEDHPNIDDIDHAYLMFGVPINAKDNPSKRYLFHFFKYMMQAGSSLEPFTVYGWKDLWNWASDNVLYQDSRVNPLLGQYGEMKFRTRLYPATPNNYVYFKNNYKLDLGLSFQNTGFEVGSGVGWVGAKMGEVKIEIKEEPPYQKYKAQWDARSDDDGIWIFRATGLAFMLMNPDQNIDGWKFNNMYKNTWHNNNNSGIPPINPLGMDYMSLGIQVNLDPNNQPQNDISENLHPRTLVLTYQIGTDQYQKIHVKNIFQRNNIYQNNTIEHNLDNAYTLPATEDSPIIIPLHEAVLSRMGYMDATEVCTQAGFVVCNCFVVHVQKIKKKGFLGFLISILVAVVVVAIAVLAPELMPGAAGLFSSVGSAMGLSGIAGTIAGAAVSMLAGIIVSQMITAIATMIFGNKFGALLGQLLTLVAGAAFSQGFSAEGLLSGAKGLLSAEGVIKMTTAVGSGMKEYFAISAQEKAIELVNFMDQANKEMQALWDRNQELADKYNKEFGRNNFLFNNWSDPTESLETFLSRTLICGSDVAAITNGFITNYCQTTLTLKPALQ